MSKFDSYFNNGEAEMEMTQDQEKPVQTHMRKTIASERIQIFSRSKTQKISANTITSPQLGAFSHLFDLSKQIFVNKRPYMKMKLIHQGNGTAVYKVMDLSAKFYALKCINSDSSSVIKHYRNEIAILKKLQGHQRIVQMYDYEIVENSHAYILLELADFDLEHIISSNYCDQPNYLRYTWQQMLECVAELHSNNIIHGNLQPCNFISVKGILKLVDFGHSKSIDIDKTSVNCTGTSFRFYSAPEMCDGHITRQSDVWSLGCILYEMVYHKPLPVISPSTVNISIPQLPRPDFILLSDVIRSCLIVQPSNRITLEALFEHAYISNPTTFFANQGLSITDNFRNLGTEILTEHADDDFNCEIGMKFISKMSQQLMNGQQMTMG